MLRIVIPLLCRSKKNSEQIGFNRRTGKRFIMQSELYLAFERDCGYFLKRYAKHINTPHNLKCTFIVPDKRRRDIVNLLNAIQDILIKYGVIEDDNYNIIAGLDGSRIIYNKGVEQTIIELTEVTNEEIQACDIIRSKYNRGTGGQGTRKNTKKSATNTH